MSYHCPSQVIVEAGGLKRLSQLTSGYDTVTCVTDEGLLRDYRGQLESLLSVTPNWVKVSDDPEAHTPGGINGVVIGFGGGRSIDTAKLIATATGLDWISIPTAASHDGIASEVASVSHNGFKYSKKCKTPIAVVADLDIISRAPPRLNLAGVGDILCKASSLSEWRFAYENFGESFNEDAYRVTENALNSVLTDGSLEVLVRAEIDAGRAMCIAGSSRPCSGTEHSISHAMERRNHDLHGMQVIFATPLCLHYLEERGYAIQSQESIHKLMESRGLPTSLKAMSMTPGLFYEYIVHALDLMERRERHSILAGVDKASLMRTIRTLY
ncbi:MAG: iron-containing alcohol dehydrogenase [Candidatus Thorarchaeota archaeon]|nr:iron-containing alcohol dehydrogenase [Candidatus Thorarchaeota archaeon]